MKQINLHLIQDSWNATESWASSTAFTTPTHSFVKPSTTPDTESCFHLNRREKDFLTRRKKLAECGGGGFTFIFMLILLWCCEINKLFNTQQFKLFLLFIK